MSTTKAKKFGCFKVKSTTPSGRGIGDDPNTIVEAFEPKWDEL